MKLKDVPVGSWIRIKDPHFKDHRLKDRRLKVTPDKAGIGMVQLSPDPMDMESDVSGADLDAFLKSQPVSAGPTYICPADTEVDLEAD